MQQPIKSVPTKQSISNRRLVHGVGINDYYYPTKDEQKMCHYYTTWVDMLKRCYSNKYHIKQPKYKDCTVAKEWHMFSSFRSWMTSQDWKGKELDKDLLIPRNKEYSSDSCVFVDQSLNKLSVGLNQNSGSATPKGVSYHKSTGKYQARCSVNGKSEFIGLFNTKELASTAYRIFKSKYIMMIATKQTDEKVKYGLFKHAEEWGLYYDNY